MEDSNGLPLALNDYYCPRCGSELFSNHPAYYCDGCNTNYTIQLDGNEFLAMLAIKEQ